MAVCNFTQISWNFSQTTSPDAQDLSDRIQKPVVVLWAPASAPNEVFPIILQLLEAAAGVGDDSQECLAHHHPGGLHCPNHLLVPGGGAGSRPSNG